MASSKLNIVKGGPTEGSTVVLIHAVGLDLTYWDRQIEALTAHHHTITSLRWTSQAMGAPLVRDIAAASLILRAMCAMVIDELVARSRKLIQQRS